MAFSYRPTSTVKMIKTVLLRCLNLTYSDQNVHMSATGDEKKTKIMSFMFQPSHYNSRSAILR